MLRLDARWQYLFPEAPRYPLPNLFQPVLPHPYAITVINLGRLQ